MVAIVPIFQHRVDLLGVDACIFGKPLHTQPKCCVHLFGSDAAYPGKLVHRGYVHQIIQPAEHRQMAILGDTREQTEMQMVIERFERRVEAVQRIAKSLLQLRRADGRGDGIIVLVNQHHHLACVSFVKRSYHATKAFGESAIAGTCQP